MPDFQMYLAKLQEISYAILFFAYEDFILQATRIGTGKNDLRFVPRQKARELKDAFRGLFGPELWSKCCENRPVRIAFLVRNAIAHNGGRETDKLHDEPHGFEVLEDGTLGIMAHHVTALYHDLKERVLSLAEEAVKKPEFSIS